MEVAQARTTTSGAAISVIARERKDGYPNFFQGGLSKCAKSTEEIGVFGAEKYFNSLEIDVESGDLSGGGKEKHGHGVYSPCRNKQVANRKVWSSNKSEDSSVLSDHHKARRLAVSESIRSGIRCKWPSSCSGNGAVETEDAAVASARSIAELQSRSSRSENSSISSPQLAPNARKPGRCTPEPLFANLLNFRRLSIRKPSSGSSTPESQTNAMPTRISHRGFNSLNGLGSASERSFNGDSPEKKFGQKCYSPKAMPRWRSISGVLGKGEISRIISFTSLQVGQPSPSRSHGLPRKPEIPNPSIAMPEKSSISTAQLEMQSSKQNSDDEKSAASHSCASELPVIHGNIAISRRMSESPAHDQSEDGLLSEGSRIKLAEDDWEVGERNIEGQRDELHGRLSIVDLRRHSFTFPSLSLTMLPPSAIPLARSGESISESASASGSPSRVDDPFGSPFSVATCPSGDYRRRAELISRLKMYTQERSGISAGGNGSMSWEDIGWQDAQVGDVEREENFLNPECCVIGDSYDYSDSSSDLFDLESFGADDEMSQRGGEVLSYNSIPVLHYSTEQELCVNQEGDLCKTPLQWRVREDGWRVILPTTHPSPTLTRLSSTKIHCDEEEEEMVLEREDEILYSEEE